MRTMGILAAALAVAIAGRARAQGCPSAPTFEAPSWVDVRDGRATPSADESRARIARWESAIRVTRADDPAGGNALLQLAEAYRDLHRATQDPNALQESVRTYARLIRDFSQHEKMDLALYRLASVLQDMNQAQRARQVYHRLIAGYPSSAYVAFAYLDFAEHYFHERDFRAAQLFYARAAEQAQGVVQAYAWYMEAWSHHERAEVGPAARSLAAARAALPTAQTPVGRMLAAALERDRCALAP